MNISSLNGVQISVSELVLGTVHLPYVAAQAQVYGDYFRYRVCSLATKDCQEGVFMSGGQILSGLAPGSYELGVAACVRPERSSNGEVCAKETKTLLQQAINPTDQVAAKVQQMAALSRQIKDFAPKIQESLAEFQKEASTARDVNPRLLELAQSQLSLGAHATAALINGPSFRDYYLKYQGLEPGPIGEPPTPAAPSPGPSVGSTPQAPSPSPSPSAPSASRGSTLGTVLISIGTVTAVYGVVAAHIGYSSSKWSRNLVAFMSQAEIKQQATSIIESVNRQMRDIMQYYSRGSFELIVEADLPAEVRVNPPAVLDSSAKVYAGPDGLPAYINFKDGYYKVGSSAFAIDALPGERFKVLSQASYNSLSPAAKAGYVAAVATDGTTIYRAANFGKVSEAVFKALPPHLQMQFAAQGTDYRLRDEFANTFQLVNNKVFKLENAEMKNLFPTLSHKTVIAAYNRYNALETDPAFRDAEKNVLGFQRGVIGSYLFGQFGSRHYMYGELMIDDKGRLIEPPPDWKFEGINWFHKNGEPLVLDVYGEQRTFHLDNPDEVVRPKSSYFDYIVGSKMWNNEIAMRYNELSLQERVSDWQNLAVNKVSNSISQNRRPLMIGGGLLAVGGLVALGVGISLNLSSPNNVNTALLAKLGSMEEVIASLHAQREQLWVEIKTILGAEQAAVIDPFWIYQL